MRIASQNYHSTLSAPRGKNEMKPLHRGRFPILIKFAQSINKTINIFLHHKAEFDDI